MYIYIHEINQDCLETFFGTTCMQNGYSINPSLI